MFSVIELTKTVVSTLNSNVNHSVFIIDLQHFEYLVLIKGILKIYVKFSMCIVIFGWQCMCQTPTYQSHWCTEVELN